MTVKDTYKAVIALPNPKNGLAGLPELSLEEDRKAIMSALELVNEDEELITPVFIEQATREKLEENIDGAHIFHFAGHGVFTDVELLANGRFLKERRDRAPQRRE